MIDNIHCLCGSWRYWATCLPAVWCEWGRCVSCLPACIATPGFGVDCTSGNLAVQVGGWPAYDFKWMIVIACTLPQKGQGMLSHEGKKETLSVRWEYWQFYNSFFPTFLLTQRFYFLLNRLKILAPIPYLDFMVISHFYPQFPIMQWKIFKIVFLNQSF